MAQIPTISETQARAELDKRGIEEDELRNRLLEKGIDLDNIQPEELLLVQDEIEATIQELEAEQAIKSIDSIATDTNIEAIQKDTTPISNKKNNPSTNPPIQEVKPLPEAVIFGQHIFRKKNIDVFQQTLDVKPADNYVLGVGDQITVSIWGLSQETLPLEINKEGYIEPSRMPRIYLKGLSLVKAKELLRSRFGAYYRFRKEEFEVSLNYARTITVNIVGEVFNYGNFTLPATNNAFNALMAAGGPSNIGSVRNIKLIRAGEAEKNLDIYEYLLNPSIANDFYLEDKDIIFVPVAEKTTTIQGAIQRPFKYELKEREHLQQLIKYAGGLTDNAYRGNIQIQRYENDEVALIDVNLNRVNRSDQDIVLNKGDVITIKTVNNIVEEVIFVDGAAVEFPGQYDLTPQMRVNDLLEKVLLKKQARLDIAYIQRRNLDGTFKYIPLNLQAVLDNPNSNDNILLQAEDKLIVYNQKRFTDNFTVTINGAIREPGTYDYPTGSIFITDLVTIAGGLKQDATSFAYIKRTNPNNIKETQYIRVDLEQALATPNSSANILIEPLDEVNIFSNLTFTDQYVVNISGAVRNPGTYQYHESLTFKDLITLAGGLKLEAATNRVDIFRLVISNNEPTRTRVATVEIDSAFNLIQKPVNGFELAPFDQIVVRTKPEFELHKTVYLDGEIKYPGPYALIEENETLAQLINRAGGLTLEAFPSGATLYRETEGVGYVIIQLEEALKSPTSTQNIVLKDGDRLAVPKTLDIVTIKGATNASKLYKDDITRAGKINIPYTPSKNAKWYIDNYAGGLDKENKARKRYITVENPNGEIKETKGFVFKNYPDIQEGSIITVGVKPAKPEKEQKSKSNKEERDWEDLTRNIIAQVTAVLTLLILARQL